MIGGPVVVLQCEKRKCLVRYEIVSFSCQRFVTAEVTFSLTIHTVILITSLT